MKKILILDDDPGVLRLVSFELEREGYVTVTLERPEDAVRVVAQERPAVALIRAGLAQTNGPDALERVRERFPALPVVLLASDGDAEEIAAWMRRGAIDFVRTPVDRARLLTAVRNADRRRTMQERIDRLAETLQVREGFDSIRGEASTLERAIGLLRRAADSAVPVLLSGESGTGKELAARAVHVQSGRRAAPFIVVALGHTAESRLESELFGHVENAFGGAERPRAGVFEQADGGTVFLDKIDRLPLELQVKLLRVLQERAVRRLGSDRPIPVDVRVISATRTDLADAVEAGTFREDLYYRLAVFPVTLPPLRQRENDRLVLAELFLERFAEEHGRSGLRLGTSARDAVLAYDWPGNVRELQSAMQRAALLSEGDDVTLSNLPDAVAGALGEPTLGALLPASARVERGRRTVSRDRDTDTRLENVDDIRPFADEERDLILRALHLTGWNIQEAATRLKLGRATIYRKIERYDLAPAPRAAR